MKREEYLFEISKKIVAVFGLDFQSNQWLDMERRVMSVAVDLQIDPKLDTILQLLSKPNLSHQELNSFSGHLTINETYFYRETAALDLLINEIIPKLISLRRGKNEKIRIWSAGCSSGEEPYTIAMLLRQHFPELINWDITILATDISPNAIGKALKGEYTDWSFRNTDESIKSKYFAPSGKNWSIIPEIKKMISFSYLNLSKNSYPSSLTNTEEMDVVFCRNVMMYFTPQVIKEVSARFKNCLIDQGWFITSQVELNDDYFSNFERVNYHNGIFYQKTNRLKQIVKQIPIIERKVERIAKPKVEIKKEIVRKPLMPIETPKVVTKVYADVGITMSEINSYFQNGLYKHCIDYCLQKIAQGHLNNQLFEVLVKSFANSGLLADGMETITKIVHSNSSTAQMYYIYASLLNEKNELQKAENTLRKAIYLDHKHVLSHLMLGDVFLKSDKHQLALKHYDIIMRLLENLNENEIVPDSDGLTAGRIRQLTESIINRL